MRLGGLDHAGERVFLLSTTHGAETHALGAARETLHIYQQCKVVERLYRQGDRLRAGIDRCITHHGLKNHFTVKGRSSNLIYATKDSNGEPSQSFRALFLQELIQGGIIAPSFVVSYSHSAQDIDRTIEVVDRALSVYAKALEDGVHRHLVGRPVKPVNRRFN
jgi:glutamate-1-semialdehyde 2,1-aminomutase